MEGHEDLAGSDDAGDAELDLGDAVASGDDGDAIVGAEFELSGVDGIHLQPRVGDHAVEHGDCASLGARMPVLDSAAGVEDEVVLVVGLLGEGLAGDGVEAGAAAVEGEDAAGVEALAAPLNAALALNLLPGNIAIVAGAAGGDALPLLVRVVGGGPAWIKLFAQAELLGDGEEDVEVGAGFAGRT